MNSPKKIRVIDLFSGVGGLSLGAARAGFDIAGAVEIDRHAIQLHKKNFPNTRHVELDISVLSGKALLESCDIAKNHLHGLIGGPPCQGFSTIGRRRKDDSRNSLFMHFFRLVDELRPAFFLAENVPGILQEQNRSAVTAALEKIPKRYIVLPAIKINASKYGVPTLRTRVFFIGFDPERCNELNAEDFYPNQRAGDFRVRDALCELPSIRGAWQKEEQSWRSVGELGDSIYARSIKGCIPKGVGNLDAINLYRKKRLVSGFLGTIHTPQTVARFERLREGETDPISKSPRLDRNGYCPTLRAGTGSERGSYQAVRPVHPTSPRVITPREAARLQGFPDWFQFHPTKWHAFRQIGNSVSPIIAQKLLGVIAKNL